VRRFRRRPRSVEPTPIAEEAIALRDNQEQRCYEILVEGEVVGSTPYERAGRTTSLYHTEVDNRFERRGLGARLVRYALEDVRARGMRLLPYCPFVRSYIVRHDEYLDLVPEGVRPDFGLD
jgi:predicted GNAT family acetyltransferase